MNWIDCLDKLPEENEAVLIFMPDQPWINAALAFTKIWIGYWSKIDMGHLKWIAFGGTNDGEQVKVTHWIKLPAHPQEGE